MHLLYFTLQRVLRVARVPRPGIPASLFPVGLVAPSHVKPDPISNCVALWIKITILAALGVALGARLSAVAGAQEFPPAEPHVVLRSVRFTGDAVALLSEAERDRLAAGAVGKPLDFAGLQDLVNRVTGVLQEKGRILARAYLPPQDVTEGILEIAVIEGSVEDWVFEGDAAERLDLERLRAIAERAARPGEPLTFQALERALLLMNDWAGLSATSRLEPGDSPGTTRVVVVLEDRSGISGTATIGNHGSAATGAHQGSMTFNVDGALGSGERLQLHVDLAAGVRHLRLGAQTGPSESGLSLSLRYTQLRHDVVSGASAAAGIGGETRDWFFEAVQPFVRSREWNSRGTFGAGHKLLDEWAGDELSRERRIAYGRLGLSGDRADEAGLSRWSVALVTGSVDLIVGWDAEGTAGPYGKFVFDLGRAQRLSPGWTLSAHVSGQWADKNLDSSEQFSLGGPSGVRAYPVGEAAGDLGVLGGIELWREVTAMSAGQAGLSIGGFLEGGWIQLRKEPVLPVPTATGLNSYTLSAAGIALAWTPSPNASVQFTWAHALRENPGRSIHGANADGSKGGSRVWVQSSFSF